MSKDVLFNRDFCKGYLHLDLSVGLPSDSCVAHSARSYFVGYYVGSSFRVLRQFSSSDDAFSYVLKRRGFYKNYPLCVFSFSFCLKSVSHDVL